MGRAVSSQRRIAKAGTAHVAARAGAGFRARRKRLNCRNSTGLIHERIRLGIVSALATNDSLSFNDLKRVLKTTDGNLSVHARKLEEAQYISCVKFFEGRVPRTEYRLTATGRKRFGGVSRSDGRVDSSDAGTIA